MVPGDAVPHDARAQLAELLRRVAPVEHVEHVLEQLARELGVGVGARDERMQLVHREPPTARHRRRRCRRSSRSRLSPARPRRRSRRSAARARRGRCAARRWTRSALRACAGDDRALEQVAAELGEDPPAAHLVDAVPGAPDALQSARDGLGRLDLKDEIDGAHVDAELERAGGDEAGQLAAPSGAPRPSIAPRARASRGGRARPPRRRARSGAARRARPSGGC